MAYCSIESCSGRVDSRGWCKKHYERWRRTGTVDPRERIRPARLMLDQLLTVETDHCIEWPHACTDTGYGQIQHDGRLARVTHLILEARVGPSPSPRHEAAHGPCHNPPCINYRHLRWATRSENILDKVRDGTHNRGEQNPRTRVTENDVREIRRRRAAGESAMVLSAEFGVSRQCVNDIYVGRRWRFVTEVAA